MLVHNGKVNFCWGQYQMEVRQENQVSGEGEIIPDYLGPWMSGFSPKLGFLLVLNKKSPSMTMESSVRIAPRFRGKSTVSFWYTLPLVSFFSLKMTPKPTC